MQKRIIQTLHMCMMFSSSKITDYLRRHKIFNHIGVNSSIMDRKIPLYANLIRIGDNVHVASKVSFITHDITHIMLNNILKANGNSERIQEKVDCIEIRNNVFIGTGTIILGGVRIGSNVIIGAGSLVTKDIPDNSVAVGVPARVIGSLDTFIEKRTRTEKYPIQPVIGQYVPKELEDWLWKRFSDNRKETG